MSSFKRIDGQIVYVCSSCDHRFVVFKDALLDDFYGQSYFDGTASLDIGYENYEYRPAADFYWQAKLVQTINSKNSSYLDVGCATGKTIEVAQMLGIESFGVELSDYAARVAVEKGLNVFNGQLEKYKPKEMAGVISLWEVIEHVQSPSKLLETVKKLLDKKGAVLISVPDATKKGADWTGYKQSLEHVSYFTEASLGFLLDKTFGEGNSTVKSFTDGVSSTLLGIVMIGSQKKTLDDLSRMFDYGVETADDNESLLRFSLLKGLGTAKEAQSYFEANSIGKLRLNYPEKDIIDGLSVLIQHRLSEDTVTDYMRSLSIGKRSNSPFWECCVYSLSENFHFLGGKYAEINTKYVKINAEKEALNKTYHDVIDSRGWKAILMLRRWLDKKK